MAQTERLYKIKSQLDAGRCLNRAALLAELGISPATLKRDLAHLRDRMNAPVIFDRERNGWRLDPAAQLTGTQYELPGLWLSADEIHALLTMQHLLAHLDAGATAGLYTPLPVPRVRSAGQERLLNRLEKISLYLSRRLESFSEEELDRLRLPHPILGRRSIREMLLFQILHNEHHTGKVRARQPKG